MTKVTKNFKVYVPSKDITEEDGTLYLEGIANTGQEDLVGDIVTETALKQIVEMAPQRNLHYNHSGKKNDLLGRIIASELRPEGAWIKTRILDEQKDWLKSYIEQGIIFGQSISGSCTYEDGSYDNIISWDLTEVSLTDTPCDPGTMGVEISKSFDDLLVALKTKERRIEENQKMAEDALSKEDIITIVNDAFNERKEELLESVREDIANEYEAKINELNERISTLEGKLEKDPEPQEPEPTPGEPNDDGKAFEERVEKEVEERVEKRFNALIDELTKGVNAKYNKNEHIEDRNSKQDDADEDKAYSAEELAKMFN